MYIFSLNAMNIWELLIRFLRNGIKYEEKNDFGYIEKGILSRTGRSGMPKHELQKIGIYSVDEFLVFHYDRWITSSPNLYIYINIYTVW